jgi:hypothetical protein
MPNKSDAMKQIEDEIKKAQDEMKRLLEKKERLVQFKAETGDGKEQRERAIAKINTDMTGLDNHLSQLRVNLEVETVAHLASDNYVAGPEGGDVAKAS